VCGGGGGGNFFFPPLGPVTKNPALFKEALLQVLLLETSCFPLLGPGRLTDYAREIHRRGEAVMGFRPLTPAVKLKARHLGEFNVCVRFDQDAVGLRAWAGLIKVDPQRCLIPRLLTLDLPTPLQKSFRAAPEFARYSSTGMQKARTLPKPIRLAKLRTPQEVGPACLDSCNGINHTPVIAARLNAIGRPVAEGAQSKAIKRTFRKRRHGKLPLEAGFQKLLSTV